MFTRGAAAVPILMALACASSVRAGTVFNVDILASSPSNIGPGGSVSYAIVGELSGDPSLGLALWGIDLNSSWSMTGSLPQLSPGPEMGSFVMPEGITNPQGYGGTRMSNSWLSQIGGGQNTIGNTPDQNPFPIGEVVLGIGLERVVLATGFAHLPDEPGNYELRLTDLFGNVIVGPGVGEPAVYPTEAFEPSIGTLSSRLAITVVPEPGTLAVLLLGACGVFRRRRGG